MQAEIYAEVLPGFRGCDESSRSSRVSGRRSERNIWRTVDRQKICSVV